MPAFNIALNIIFPITTDNEFMAIKIAQNIISDELRAYGVTVVDAGSVDL